MRVEAVQTALNAVLPAFFLIALGGVADKVLPAFDVSTLTRLSVYILIPALVFNAIAGTAITLSEATLLSVAYLVYLVVLGIAAAIGAMGLSSVQMRGVIVSSLFGNTGNMGLPITLFAYGEEGLERAVIIMVVSLALMFLISPPLLAGGGGSVRARLVATLKLPPMWATLAGLLFNLQGWVLPLSVGRSTTLLANAAISVMLLSLGMQMHRSWVWGVGQAALRATIVRLIIGPIVALAVAYFMGLPLLDRNVLVLSAALPVAVTIFVVAVEVRGDYEGIARTVVATTVGSLAAIIAVIFYFPG